MRFLCRAAALTLTATAFLSGCTTTGMGAGEVYSPGKPLEPVLFSWKSSGGGMVATLPNATYTGRFFQITRDTQSETLALMWTGWNEGWYDWPYWSQPWPATYNITQFIRHYSGKVVANLGSNNGLRMRCRFHLADPAGGMSGGAQGECQFHGGRIINAEIDRR